MLRTIRRSIQYKLSLISISIMSITLIFVSGIFLHSEYKAFNQQLGEEVARLIDVVGAGSIASILLEDDDAAKDSISILHQNKNIIHAGIKSENKTLAITSQKNHPLQKLPLQQSFYEKAPADKQFIVFEKGKLLYAKKNIYYKNKPIAYMYVIYDISKRNMLIYQAAKQTLMTFVFGLLLTLFFVYFSQKHLISPLLSLAQKMNRISSGKSYELVETEKPIASEDEIAALVDGFNTMLIELQSRDKELREKNKELAYQAYHDALTNLPNLTLFKEFLSYQIDNREGYMFAVLFIDLDNFKTINDTFGHHIGDALLQTFSRILKKLLRKSDVAALTSSTTAHDTEEALARMGGDEFIVLLKDIKSERSINRVLLRIFDEFKKPVRLNNQDVKIELSLGISIFPNDSKDVDELIQFADTAMYEAKQRGKNQFQYFNQSLHTLVKEQFYIEQDLRQAVENQEFILYYQPQVNIHTHQVIGFEALIRWKHPEKGMIPPGSFIPIAESSQIILPIGKWIIETACETLGNWQKAGYKNLQMAINISPIQFKDKHLLEKIESEIKKHQLEPNTLVLEITEGALMEDHVFTANIRKAFANIGVLISIDDFGTGYSSFRYLIAFNADVLKIDKCFIDDITKSKEANMVADSIKNLAHGLKMKLVAEGVETNAQLKYLKDNAFDIVQGYIFSKPCTKEDATLFLEKNNTP